MCLQPRQAGRLVDLSQAATFFMPGSRGFTASHRSVVMWA